MNPRLRVTVGKQRGQEYEVPPQEEKASVILGRGTFCEIRLLDMQLSRRHCRFTFDGENLFVEDMGSKNGTRVNSETISERTMLEEGDEISVGSTSLVVQKMDSSPELERVSDHPSRTAEREELASQVRHLEGRDFADLAVKEKLHEGDICVTYRAVEKHSGNVCALRIIKPDARISLEHRNRFIRGAKYAAQLHHPNILRVFKGAKHLSAFYVVTEYFKGVNLQATVQEEGALEVDRAVEITGQLLAAVGEAYDQGLVLRAVRPHDVLVGSDLTAKLINFELVKPFPTEEEKQVTRIVDGRVNIQPAFAAPELIVYPVMADQRADLFGVGACLYFMITGNAPFYDAIPRDSVTRVFERHFEDPRDFRDDLPDELVELINKSLAEQPHDRYQTPEEMREDMEKLRSTV